uniref:Uncharacterized protein n=1 Tax=Kalanchoe fedtschenkoi TaxID=63787 RepID=A0A7N0VGM1_KALFE
MGSGAVPPGQWTTGLCGCCEDMGNCCMTCCCPCITFGRNAEIIERGASTCCCSGCLFYILSIVGCGCLYSCGYRTRLRSQYSLPEEPCGDCCVHLYCLSCSLCQEHRELKNRGLDPTIGWAGNAHRMNAPGVAMGMYRN